MTQHTMTGAAASAPPATSARTAALRKPIALAAHQFHYDLLAFVRNGRPGSSPWRCRSRFCPSSPPCSAIRPCP